MMKRSSIALLLLTLTTRATPASGFLTAPPAFTRQPKKSLASIATTAIRSSSNDDEEFLVGVLGDLHLDPRDMKDYKTGREHWRNIFRHAKNPSLVSLGDLGESKPVKPDVSSELFSGTTECHKLAASYLKSFGVPYELVGGNHGTC